MDGNDAVGLMALIRLGQSAGRGSASLAITRASARGMGLVAQFEFAEWTFDNYLRHGRFIGPRDDKLAREVRRE